MADRYSDWERQRRRHQQEQNQSNRSDWNRNQNNETDWGNQGRRWNQPGGNQDQGYDYEQDRWSSSDYGQGRWSGRGYGQSQGSGMDRNQWNQDYGYNQGSDYESDFENDYGPTYWTYEEWWLVPGPYTGMGPQGYSRSDEAILEDVCERLTQHGGIDASDMDIDVNDGEVTLKGDVPERRMKRMAEDVAESVSGVRDVHNQLHVKHGEGHRPMREWTREQQEQARMDRMSEQQQRQTSQTFDEQRQEQAMGSMSGQQQGQTMDTMSSGPGQRSHQMHRQVHEGMQVMGADNKDVGTVKQIRENDFLVDRTMARDVFVPFSACQSISSDRIMLNIKASEVDKQGWPNPEIAKNPATEGKYEV